MPLRTIGWTNVSGRPGSRIPAVASSSAASAASASSRPASRAAWSRSLCSRIASARASRPACSGSRRSRRRIERPTVARRFARRGARLRGRGDASFAQRIHELAHQERRPARRAQAGVDEDRIRSAAEPRLDELGDRRSRQRRQPDRPRRTDRSSRSRAARHRCPPRAGGSRQPARRRAPRAA